MNAEYALANLVDARDALVSCGARPFLVDGTLLGCIREGGFIGHDLDVDLGCFIEDLDVEAMTDAMTSAGFAPWKSYGTPERGFQLSFKRHGIKLDVFFYYIGERLTRFHAAWLKDTPIRYTYPPFSLAPVSFLGETFLAPDDPVRFLVTKYGLDWRTPVTPWDWAWGPKNATPWSTEESDA
jgi:hypothetical protein